MPTPLFVRSLHVLLVALLFAAPAGAEPLRWKFKPGQTLNYVLERGVEGKINLSGAEIEFTLTMIFDTTWQPKSVAADGTANVELTVDRIQLEMASPLFGGMKFDSKSGEKPEEGPAWSQLEPIVTGMLGETFQTKITPLGQVADIQFPKKLADTLAAQQIGENRRQGFGIGGNAFSEQGLKELIARSVLPLPEAEGKDWTQVFENDMPGMGKQTSETTFKTAGTETKDGKTLAKIEATSELLFEPAENPRAELEITAQESTATYLFDAAAGQMIEANGTQKVNMEISGPQELTQEMKETMKMRQGKSPDKPAEKTVETKEGAK